MQKEIEAHKEKLERAKKHEHSILEDLDNVGRKLSEIESDLRKRQGHLRQTESAIKKVREEISIDKEELDRKKKWLRRRLRAMQRCGQSGDILFLLTSADDIAGLARRWKYLELVAVSDRKKIEEYAENLRRLDEREKQLEVLVGKLRSEEGKVKLAETSFSEKKREKEVLLASVKREKVSHEKLLRELQEASKRLLEVIKKLDEKETFTGKGFSSLRGNLSWPVNGRVSVPYGSQKDPKFNTPVFRNGVYIKTNDDSVKAVYTGKVVFSDWFKGYGNLVIINHGEGYHTLYGNLAETFLKVGDIIKGKDIIGKVGESGLLNAPSLYFEVRYKGKPLDPMQWLKRK